MALQVPREGLEELFRFWVGDGDLFGAVAAAGGVDEVSWTAGDVRARAQRILLGKLEPQLLELPTTVEEWELVIPITSETGRHVDRSPRGRVNWATTARRYGWPPTAFDIRRRYRVHDETALTTLAWVSAALSTYLDNVTKSSPQLAGRLSPQVSVLEEATAALLGDTAPRNPDRLDLLSLKVSDRPWPLIASIAALILRSQTDWEFLAFELLEPDPETAHRLFHLVTFGRVVQVLRSAGYGLTWRAPIGRSRPGPRLTARSPSGRTLELWFEAAGARSYYHVGGGTYPEVVSNIEGVGDPIGADVAIIEAGKRSLLLECKWSERPEYVGRDGYHQASSYALDARNGIAEAVWSFIVGPGEVIPSTNTSEALVADWNITLGSTSVASLPSLIGDFLTKTE